MGAASASNDAIIIQDLTQEEKNPKREEEAQDAIGEGRGVSSVQQVQKRKNSQFRKNKKEETRAKIRSLNTHGRREEMRPTKPKKNPYAF